MSGRRRWPSKRRRRQRGFTLLELLVAITLMALIGGMMVGGIHFGARVWEETLRRDQDPQAVIAVQAVLRRQIAQALPVLYRAPTGQVGTALAGTSAALVFVGPMPSYLGRGGRHLIGLQIEGGASTRNLILKWQPFSPEHPDLTFTEQAHEEVLLHGIQELRLAYYGSNGNGETERWQDVWRGQALPQLVRIEVVFPAGDRRVWPELIARVMTGAVAH